MPNPKKTKKKVPDGTTSIQLNVPNDIYDSLTLEAREDGRETGHKKSLHDKMIETLRKGAGL